jgi:hypothetical protein
LVTTTGTGLTAGADDEPDPVEPDEPEPVEPEPDGTEGAGADGIDGGGGGGGALKVNDADGVLAALEPIAFLATTVNVYAVPVTKPVITQLVAVVVVQL